MYEKILIPVDGSACSEKAARLGLALAGKLNAQVIFAHVVAPWPALYTPEAKVQEERYRAEGQSLLERWEQTAKAAKVEAAVQLEVSSSTPEALTRLCEEKGCDLIVMGTHSRKGLEQLFLGSVAERVSRLAKVPVMLVRDRAGEGEDLRLERILAAIDGSPLSDLALEHAKHLTERLGASLHLLYVVPTARRYLHEPQWAYELDQAELRKEGEHILAEAARDLPQAEAILRDAAGRRIGEVITAVAHEKSIDLIVMGTHGRSGLSRFLLGSVAEWVAHHAQPAILLVRETR
ncbi:UspA domain protein [Allomeiothermus silvanus DSM 9946]|uniref:UspA domain protein n=1 Tax=Allomeiothermus silvanus (strain ATCC 700542 / DSM 9946 / NBRC 106475 / NCIMB 13440 / VI-R2) TaxID=526227 RepID=D7BEQ3_ALLS1|nr:universal stress protein [Allomeiothermus silvanus]ADH64999.1 UspA domain protein [Allomeiothermus silvanus DSM 9946]